MYQINKFFERVARFCRHLISDKHKLNHKYQNKNQITNTNLILNSLYSKGFNPRYIVDVGCGHGEWTKKTMKYFNSSNYLLFDANEDNKQQLNRLISENNNISFKIELLTDDNKDYKFYKMGYGSSIYKEQTSNMGEVKYIKSKKLSEELPSEIKKTDKNLIKLDTQGSELKILNGLDNFINFFEVIILETSIHNYNKNAPLFNEVINYMKDKNYRLYDIFDMKRLGNENSFLLQFDCIFVRSDSKLLKINLS